MIPTADPIGAVSSNRDSSAERGAVLPLMALPLIALMGAAAIAIDLGRLP